MTLADEDDLAYQNLEREMSQPDPDLPDLEPAQPYHPEAGRQPTEAYDPQRHGGLGATDEGVHLYRPMTSGGVSGPVGCIS